MRIDSSICGGCSIDRIINIAVKLQMLIFCYYSITILMYYNNVNMLEFT